MSNNIEGKIVVITGASSGLGEHAIPADAFARAVVYAMSQPDDVDINEILFRPTSQEM